ncbi:MAG TPA: AAA domain-containing protein [bacterium]|nr:AAA domain-containing protein [bacterium]
MTSSDISRLAQYYQAVTKLTYDAANKHLTDVFQAGVHDYVDMSFLQNAETLFKGTGQATIRPPSAREELFDIPAAAELHSSEGPANNDPAVAFDRLKRLHQRQVLNPYEREIVYGYPFLVGVGPRDVRICAPLFTVRCAVTVDLPTSAVKIRLVNDSLTFNSQVWPKLLTEQQQHYFELSVRDLRVPSLPLADADFTEFVRTVANATSAFAPPLDWEWTLEKLTRGRAAAGPRLDVMPCAALLLVANPQYYLQSNLAALADPDLSVEGSVLASMFGDASQPVDAAAEESPSGEETVDCIFPFASNPPQRSVLSCVDSHRLVEVQGPPGTGKSQTICNLVCHLVAEGKSVLVTSQKNKALEVVSDKLNELGVEYLSMTLLRDDAESKRLLQQKLQAIDAHLQTSRAELLSRSLSSLEMERVGLRHNAAELSNSFSAARQQEHQSEPLFRSYHATRSDDVMPSDIRLPDMEDEQLVQRMQDYLRRFASGSAGFEPSSWWRVLSSWAQSMPLLNEEPTTVANGMLSLAGILATLGELLAADGVVQTKTDLLADQAFSPSLASRILQAIGKVEPHAIQFAQCLELMRQRYDDVGLLREQAAALSVYDDDMRSTARDDLTRMISIAEKVRANRDCRWYHMRRRWQRMRARAEITDLARRLPVELCQNSFVLAARAGDTTTLLKQSRRLLDVLALSDLQSAVELALREQPFDCLSIDDLLSVASAKEHIDIVTKALSALVKGDELVAACANMKPIASAYEVLQLTEGNKYKKLRETAEVMRRLALSIEQFAALRQAEPALGPHLAAWLRDETATPRVLQQPLGRDQLLRLVRARRFNEAVQADLCSHPHDTASVAVAIKKNEHDLAENTAKLLRRRVDTNLGRQYASRDVGRDVATLRKALRRSRRNFESFERLKNDVNFSRILDVLPCWVMNVNDVCRVFPLEPGLFDVVIVDEASQCHLMGALPLLYRAKSAIVVGDEKQLPNSDLMFFPVPTNALIKRRYGIDALPKAFAFDVLESSLLDLVALWRERKVFLNEHYRSLPEIIAFSNSRFYSNQLRIMTHGAAAPVGGAFEVIHVQGALEDENSVNQKEADLLIADLTRRMRDPAYENMSFGVLSLYREQAAYIRAKLEDILIDDSTLATRSAREPLIASTVDGFQGDERDVIFYSFRYAPNSHPGVVLAIQQANRGESRMNVAFTRARKKVICYTSMDVSEFPAGLVRDFLIHCKNPNCGPIPALSVHDSPFEEDVCMLLERRGLNVIPQYPACGFRIDLVVTDASGRRLAVECDGRFHYDDAGELRIEDIERQHILERAGWHVFRVPSRKYWHSRDQCIEQVVRVLAELPAPSYHAQVSPARQAPTQTPFEWEVAPTAVEAVAKEVRPQVRSRLRPAPAIRQTTSPKASAEAAAWYALARWAKMDDHLTPKARNLAFTIGQYHESARKLPAELEETARVLWEAAEALGFRHNP